MEGHMSAHELLDLFLAAQASQNHSVRTIEWYRYEIDRFFNWLLAAGLNNGNWLQPSAISRLRLPVTTAGCGFSLAGSKIASTSTNRR
jgi:hypothetical protein